MEKEFDSVFDEKMYYIEKEERKNKIKWIIICLCIIVMFLFLFNYYTKKKLNTADFGDVSGRIENVFAFNKNDAEIIYDDYTPSYIRSKGGYKQKIYSLEDEHDGYIQIIVNESNQVIEYCYITQNNLSEKEKKDIKGKLLKSLHISYRINPILRMTDVNKFSELDYESWKTIDEPNKIGITSKKGNGTSDYINKCASNGSFYNGFAILLKDDLFENVCYVSSRYGWSVNKSVVTKNATESDRKKGITHCDHVTLYHNDGSKGYLRIFYNEAEQVRQVEFYTKDKHISANSRKMLIYSMFEDFITDYDGNDIKASTWETYVSKYRKIDGYSYKGIIVSGY